MNIYLRPLMEELKELWHGIDAYESHLKCDSTYVYLSVVNSRLFGIWEIFWLVCPWSTQLSSVHG
jgi:hypothetical protein